MNRIKLYKKALKTWGDQAQVMMLFEEMAELQKEICHSGRKNKVSFRCDLINEFADVEIMLEQMHVMYGISYDEIYNKKKEKLRRLEKKLEAK